MKKLLFLFTTILLISCSSEDEDLGLNDPNKPLSEKLASMTSPEEWFFEIYNETTKTYNAWYFFQDGNLMNTKQVSDNWYGDTTDGIKYKCDWNDHKLNEITILNDTPNSFVWDITGRTYSLVLSGNTISYERNNYVYATATLITKEQLEDFQSKYSTYDSCP
jgi:hypothetical protein